MNHSLVNHRFFRHHVRQLWRQSCKVKSHSAAEHAAYALLLDLPVDAMFPPLTRPSKIQGYANGNAHVARDEAIRIAQAGLMSAWTPWKEALSELPTKYSGYQGGLEAIVQAIAAQVPIHEETSESVLSPAA